MTDKIFNKSEDLSGGYSGQFLGLFKAIAFKADLDNINLEEELRQEGTDRPTRKHFTVKLSERICEISEQSKNRFGRVNGKPRYFNGTHWEKVQTEDLARFASEVGEHLQIDKYEAKYFKFADEAAQQIIKDMREYIPETGGPFILNCKNGTLEITPQGVTLRGHRPEDCLLYCLPYEYQEGATAPKFEKFLREVLPDPKDSCNVQEFFGSCFAPAINHEKLLYLYGQTGSNGKTTILKILSAAIGRENVVNMSLESLLLPPDSGTGEASRAALEGKILNVCGEVGKKLGNSTILKQLSSREALTVRSPYEKEPHTLAAGSYARLCFSCNELPVFAGAYKAEARRFLFVNFTQQITGDKVNRGLADEIIAEELPGVLNWIIQGLQRIARQGGKFTTNPNAEAVEAEFLEKSNNIIAWLEEFGIMPDTEENRKKYKVGYTKPLADRWEIKAKDLYKGSPTSYVDSYCHYCLESNLTPVSKNSFLFRLRAANFQTGARTAGARAVPVIILRNQEQQES